MVAGYRPGPHRLTAQGDGSTERRPASSVRRCNSSSLSGWPALMARRASTATRSSSLVSTPDAISGTVLAANGPPDDQCVVVWPPSPLGGMKLVMHASLIILLALWPDCLAGRWTLARVRE